MARASTSKESLTGPSAWTTLRSPPSCSRCWSVPSTGSRPDYRTALVMHDVEGLSNSDIAETLGVSLPAVKSRVHRSRLWVRKQLAEYLQPR